MIETKQYDARDLLDDLLGDVPDDMDTLLDKALGCDVPESDTIDALLNRAHETDAQEHARKGCDTCADIICNGCD